MKTVSRIFIGFIGSFLPSLGAVVWSGSTSTDPFESSNWDFSGSSVTSIVSNVSIEDDINIVGGAVEIPNLAGQVRVQIGNGYKLTLDNATLGLVAGGNDGVGGEPAGTGVEINLLNGSELNTFFIVNGVTLNIDSTSSATFGGGGNPINISTVNLVDGATLQFLLEDPTEFTNEHLSKVFVNGAPAVDGSNILIESFNGGQGSKISVISIPEPSSVLLSLLGVAFLSTNRKR